MKWISYAVNNPVNKGTEEFPVWDDKLLPLEVPYSDTALEIVKETAYNGEYTIEEDETPEPEPSQLDVIEAQVTYTAMMTDTLLEV